MSNYPSEQQPYQTTGSYPPNGYPSNPGYPPPYPPQPSSPMQPYPQQPMTPYPPQPSSPMQPYGYPQSQPGYPPMPPLQPMQPPKKKKKGLLITGIIIGALVLCGVIATASSHNTGTKVDTTSANTESSSSNSTTGSSNTTNSQPAASTQHFKPGDTVSVGSIWQVVVSNVRTDPGGQFDSLKSGDTYLAIDASFKNISNQEEQLFGSADWTLKDPSGQTYTSSYDSNITAQEPQGKVEAGDPGKGTLVYEVPASIKQFTLAFEDNMFESGQTIWDISVS